ncbi:MAG: DUF2283 domain-containing protein [Deltaproteobacteria bacterium]|nr:DUF2283 domain-containing protein [Deltaproteobacteria bacterium]
MAKAAVAHEAPTLDLNYDPEGDVLYVNFGPPQAADDSDITDEGIILHLKEEKLVGLTILNAKERLYNVDLLRTSQEGKRRRGKRQGR